MALVEGKGVLRYEMSKDYGYRLVLDIDRGIQLFYQSLIPKWIKVNGVRNHPHITLVRRARPPKVEAWGKYEGEVVSFVYDTEHKNDDTYWWLNCYSHRLEEIAEELGIVLTSKTAPALGYKKTWHTTIANMKSL